MAYDGIVAAATVKELNEKLLSGSIVKVAQPEKDELLLTLKINRQNLRLLISVNPSLPMICLKEDTELSPVTAPNFCMVLRKHIGGGRLLRIFQAEGFERIIIFEIEHLDEMFDTGIKYLIVELMGRYSNIILTDSDKTIIDSIKHINLLMSSVREVLPGKKYFIPETTHKGFGKVIDNELKYRAGLQTDIPESEYTPAEKNRLNEEYNKLISDIKNGIFSPNIVYENKKLAEFSAIRLHSLTGGDFETCEYDSMMEVVHDFYYKREKQNSIKTKSEDLRAVLKKLTERSSKKLDLLEKQYIDTEDRDKYRVYGELLNTYGYGLQPGEKTFTCENYYDNGNEITIPVDPTLSANQNAAKYFDRYQKLKRTREAAAVQIKECKNMLYHLESIRESLCLCETEADINVLRNEMADAGYIKKQNGTKKQKERKEDKKSMPLHFVSSDGVDIYVGRNNQQNEELDFHFADNDDWWFHAKNVPGSHVIARTGKNELKENTLREAAALAAYYSKNGSNGYSGKIEVDYVKKKELKKVPGTMTGFVIYHSNSSIMIEAKPEI